MADAEKLTLTLEEAAKILGIGRSMIYSVAHANKIPTIRMGKRWLVPRAALEKFLADVPAGGLLIASSLQGPTTRSILPTSLRAMLRYVQRTRRRLDTITALMETRVALPIMPAEIAALSIPGE